MQKVEALHTCQTKHTAYTREKLEAIEAQTVRTNGRVTKTEEELEAVKLKQENMAVKVGAGVFTFSTIAAYLLNKLI